MKLKLIFNIALSVAMMPIARAASSDADLERKVDILAEEVAHLREQMVLPEKEELVSVFGLGPAASKVYGLTRGLAIGGYGEFNYANRVADAAPDEKDQFDIPRVVLYGGYKFSKNILMNVEFEFEHARVAEVEFGYLDFLLHNAVNLRAGLVLLPVGIINELHEPTVFRGNLRPAVERLIIPTTWREIGVGLFGEPIEGLLYKVYVVAGMDATQFSSAGWVGGRQHGREALGEDLAVVARLDYDLGRFVRVGGSFYWGGADQGQVLDAEGDEVPVDTSLGEGHAQIRWRGLELRALGAFGHLRNAGLLSQEIDPEGTSLVASDVFGAYGEVSYDLLSLFRRARMSLSPWVRVERVDTQFHVPVIKGRELDEARRQTIVTAGVDFKPVPQVAIKIEFQNAVSDSDEPAADTFFAGAGFIF